MIKVIDDFLPDMVFKTMHGMIQSNYFQWQYEPKSSSATVDADDHMMSSMMYSFREKDLNIDSFWHIFFQTHHHYTPFQVPIRLKANLYLNKGRKISHSPHTDIPNNNYSDGIEPNVITSVFNFHDCNGSTNIIKSDGTEEIVESKANRIVFFDNGPHYGVTQDDQPIRIVLNMNVWTKVPDGLMQ